MNLIVAADRHWAIGKDRRVLVTTPADQQTLMREAADKVVAMGRKTLENLPGEQPLGNRENLVLARDEDYKIRSTHVCRSLKEAMERFQTLGTSDIYIIDGQSIYKQFLPYADTVCAIRIGCTCDADAFSKNLENNGGWRMTDEGDEQTYSDPCYTLQEFQRIK